MNKKMSLIVPSIILIIISAIFTFNLSNSRYIGKIKTEDDVLAIPVITLNNNKQKYIVENFLPGNEQEYLFQVSNVDEQQKNAVLMTYYFKINMQTEVPLKIEIYEILTDGTEKKLSITENVTESFNMNVVTEEADKIIKNYKLKIIWEESHNSFEYAGKTLDINVILEAIQVVKEI